MGKTASRLDYDLNNSHKPLADIAWMYGVSPNISLSALSIPGTHQSVSFKWGPACVCQSWPLYDQLLRGIRFLDIRVRHMKNKLLVYHDKFYLGLELDDVLKECFRFLDDYPSEAILMRIKKENTDKDNTETISKTIKKLLVPADRFYLARDDTKLPLIKQVRGRIVVLKNFPGDKIGYPYNSADIKDDWQVKNLSQSSIDAKWRGVEEHLQMALNIPLEDLCITYTSGAGWWAYPRAVAKRINPKLYSFLEARKGQQARWGVIVMDFPGTGLVKLIIDSNFYL